MSNWYKPHLKSVYNAQDKTFVSRLNRLRFFHDRRVLKFLRWKKGDLGRRLRGVHSLRWYKMRYRFGLKFYNFSSKKRRKLRVFRQNNLYKVGLDRKKNFLSFYRKFDESKIRIWFKEYYNKSRQYKVLNFFRLFETRLDVLCFRMKLLPTIFLANMFIKKTGILINYSLVKEPGKRVAIGDLISFENPLQWNFFSSRFTEQLWKRWHRFRELNMQRKKTRLLIFREYYKKTFNIQTLDKKDKNVKQFAILENNWNFFLNKSTKNKVIRKKNYFEYKVFNKTFWFLKHLLISQNNSILTKYLSLLDLLVKSRLKLTFSSKKIIRLILIQYMTKKLNSKSVNYYSFNSLIIFYKNYFNFLDKKSKTKNTPFLFQNFIQYISLNNRNIKKNKNFILLSNLYCQNNVKINKVFLTKKHTSSNHLDLFNANFASKIKENSRLVSNNKNFINIKENSLKTKMNFWIKNLLPFLRFNFNLKNLTEVLFLQFFSNKPSYNFFFLKFWLSYRKFLLNFSKIFSPLSKLFHYMKLFKTLVSQFDNKKVSYSWFWKSFYSRFFIQKLNILINFKDSFNSGSSNLKTFFKLLKSFLNPSIYLKNQHILTNSLYKANLVLKSSLFKKEVTELFNKNTVSKKEAYKFFNKLFQSNSLIKLFNLMDKTKQKNLKFDIIFNKYFNNTNSKNTLKSFEKLFFDYLNYVYLNTTRVFNESFIVEALIEKNNIDHKDVFFQKKSINSSQKQFVNLALSNSLNIFSNQKNSIDYNNYSQDFFDLFKVQNSKTQLELQGYLNYCTQQKVVRQLKPSIFFNKKQSTKSFLPLNWLSSSSKSFSKLFLTRNLKRSNLNTKLIKSISNLSFKSTSLKKKRITWKKFTILPKFKRYRKSWKSKYWNLSQIRFLKSNLLQKNLQKKVVSRLKIQNITKNKSFYKIINRFYIRKVLSKNFYSNLFYSKNVQLLTYNNIQPYLLSKTYKKKSNFKFKSSMSKGSQVTQNNFLILKETLRIIHNKVNFTLNISNKKYYLTFLKKQIILWKNSMISLLLHLDPKVKRKINVIKIFARIRKLVKNIKVVFTMNLRQLKTRILVSSLSLLNIYFKKLFSLIDLIPFKQLRNLKKKKNINKFWLKFRLKLKRTSREDLFKRQKINTLERNITFNFEPQNKTLFFKQTIDKPFRKTYNFIKRSKKRRKNYKLGQKQSNQRWLRKQKKRFCDINLTKWSKLKDLKQKKSFNEKIWLQDESLYLKTEFINNIKKKFSQVSFFEKFVLLEANTKNISSLLYKAPLKTKKKFLLKNFKLQKENYKRNILFFDGLLKKKSKNLDFIKAKKIRFNKPINSKSFLVQSYKNNYDFLFKVNTLRRYKSLINYHQRWNRNSTVRLKYKMRSKLLKLNKIRRLRKKKFFNIRNKPLLLLPSFVEFDFVTFRSYVISTPNLEASLYGGATNSYFYSFLSFYQRLGL